MVVSYEWICFSIKLSYQIVNSNADSADRIPKKRCLLFKWVEWKKQSEKYKSKETWKDKFYRKNTFCDSIFLTRPSLKSTTYWKLYQFTKLQNILGKITGQPHHHPVISFFPLVDTARYSCIQPAVNRYFLITYCVWSSGLIERMENHPIFCHWFQWDCPYWFFPIVIIPLKQKKTCASLTDVVFSELNEDPV